MSNKTEEPSVPQRCSFCGKPRGQVRRLFSGHNSNICNECVVLCSDLLQSAPSEEPAQELSSLPTPADIKNFLDQYVIGQESAKKTVAVAVYNHYKRINHQVKQRTSGSIGKEKDEVELEKSNILLLGPTGTGKTLIARSLAKFLRVPFTIADATVLTEAGYVGEDVENILVRLFQASDFSATMTERGIIYIDELDKISRKDGNPSITRDVSGEGVQQALLKILEGTVANIPPKGGRKHPEQSFVPIDTSNILFICGGAFEGLDKVIARRQGEKIVGFETERKEIDTDPVSLLESVTPGDLIEYGLIPELVGRLPVVAGLGPLDEAAMMNILTVPKNSLIKQFTKLLEMEGIKLTFEPEALKETVRMAAERKTGARALRSILEKAMTDIMYDVPSSSNIAEVVVTSDAITKQCGPKIIKKSRKKRAG